MNLQLIRLLSDGKLHSGTALGSALGVTRAAISKQINQLVQNGIPVETVQGRGYQLAKDIDLLDKEALRSGLGVLLGRDAIRLDVHGAIASTNTFLKDVSHAPGSEVQICLAEQQTEGRGRRGKQWASPFAENLYLSIAMVMPDGYSSLAGYSLVVGAVLCDRLSQLYSVSLGVKWPNDIWAGEQKLGGILIEVEGEHEGPVRVITGIGLNVYMTEQASIDQPWTSLAKITDQQLCRSTLAVELIAALVDSSRRFQNEGLTAFLPLWEKYDLMQGREVTLSTASSSVSGVYRGIDVNGNALLEKASGVQESFAAGELSLRPVTEARP